MLLSAIWLTQLSSVTPSPCFSVLDFGAIGDGVRDDTAAFKAALAAAAPALGCVRVPPVAAGGGYVITTTVEISPGVALIGALAGYPAPPSCYINVNATGGSRIFARPSADQYNVTAQMGEPLFHLLGEGITVRGIYVLYDRVPYPTDREIDAMYPAGFGDASARYVAEHVPPHGPTFYITNGVRVEIADVIGANFRTLIYFAGGGHGEGHIRRVQGWGYDALITVEQAMDVLTFEQVHMIINASPFCIGAKPASCSHGKTPFVDERCRGNFTVIPAIVVLRSTNVLLWLGRADGYVGRELFAFGVNTAVRLGSSVEFPLRNPVTGKLPVFAGGVAPRAPGVQAPATGPWGTLSQLMVDQCVYGIHFVWPNPLSNRFSDIQLHPSFWDDGSYVVEKIANGSGTGYGRIAKEAAIMVEPTHTVGNNANLGITTMLSNFVIASFDDHKNFGHASHSLGESNGRAFILRGDGIFDVRGFAMNNERNGDTHLWVKTETSLAKVRIASPVINYDFVEDILIV